MNVRGWQRLSFAARIAVLLVGASTVPLFLLTIYNETVSRDRLVESVRAQNFERAHGTAEIIGSFVDGAAADLRTLAALPDIVALPGDRADAGLRSRADVAISVATNEQAFAGLYVTDNSGEVLASTIPGVTPGGRQMGRSFLGAVAGRTALDHPAHEPQLGRVVLRVSTPVYAGRRITGTVTGLVDFEEIDRLVARDTNYGRYGEFGMLWTDEGIRISHPSGSSRHFEPLIPLSPDAELAQQQRLGPAYAPPRHGRALGELWDRGAWLLYDASAAPSLRLELPDVGFVHATIVPLSAHRWLYAVFTPEAPLLTSIHAQTLQHLLIAVFMALTSVLLGVLVARRVAKPLQDMTTAVHAFAMGRLDHRLRLRQGGEIGQLAAAFDAMADSLASKDAQLRAYTTDLERRVEERTATLRELYDRAEEANRLKDEFLGTVSHELRTPLNAILGWSRMLLAGQLNELQERRALETIDRNARAQALLVDELLDVSRIASGKMSLDIRSLDLRQIVEAAAESVRHAVDTKRLSLTLDIPVLLISGDQHRLQQVFWNLLANAVKFTPAGGRVRVAAHADDAHAHVVVEDSGIGIEPEFLPHVFDPFRQADSTTTRSFGGLGLGLALVRQIVELHGGAVVAHSDGPGTGTRLTVTLPLALLPLAGPSMELRAEPGRLDGLRLLIVDDERDSREFLVTALQERGASVRWAEGAAQGLALLHDGAHVDAVLADVGMPEEDGYSFVAKVRRSPVEHIRRVPVVAVTAYATAQDRQRALASGFDAHVAKPVDINALVEVVTRVARSTLT